MKKKIDKLQREDKMTLSALDTCYDIVTTKGVSYTLKPLSVAKLGLLARLNTKLSELGELEMFMVMFWAAVEDTKVLLTYIREDNVEDSFYNFLDRFLPQDIQTIIDITKKMSDVTNAGVVEIEEDDTEKK